MQPQDLIKRLQDVKRRADEALCAATAPDHKLAVLANFGDIALSLLTPAAEVIDQLVKDVRDYNPDDELFDDEKRSAPTAS